MTEPLYFDITTDGDSDLDAAMQFLSQTNGTDYAERFTEAFGAIMTEACQRVADEIAGQGRPYDRTHENASLRFTAPVYRLSVSASKTRNRRSSIGLWYVFYRLEDVAGIGRADTLFVVAVRHSAAQPFTLEDADNETP